jgi:dCTP deaminase
VRRSFIAVPVIAGVVLCAGATAATAAPPKGVPAKVQVLEVEVVLERPALTRTDTGRVQTAGPPLTLRLILTRVVTADGVVRARWLLFTNVDAALVDPKHFDPKSFVERQTDVCIVPPNSFALARTVEYFRIPRDILTICLGKSTYARCGIIVNVTPLEPEWEGHVTIEISNTTPLPAKIYANEGICQFLFLKGDQPCEVSYADRAGKYMKQTGVTLPRI